MACSASLIAKDFEKKIEFKPGSTSQVVEGSVIRGDRDIHSLYAREKP